MEYRITPRTAKLHQVFVGEGRYDLCLRIGELVALQELTDSGPALILARLKSDHWKIDDIRQTIRLALVGGGMGQEAAFDLVERCVTSGYLLEYRMTAAVAIQAALCGPEEDPAADETDDAGEPAAPPTSETMTPDSESDGRGSIGSAAPRVSRRRKSTK